MMDFFQVEKEMGGKWVLKGRVFPTAEAKKKFEEKLVEEMDDTFFDSNFTHAHSNEYVRKRSRPSGEEYVKQCYVPHTADSHYYSEDVVEPSFATRLDPFLTYKFSRRFLSFAPAESEIAMEVYLDDIHLPVTYSVISVRVPLDADTEMDSSPLQEEITSKYASAMRLLGCLFGSSAEYFPVSTKFMYVLKLLDAQEYYDRFQEHDTSECLIAGACDNHLADESVQSDDFKEYMWMNNDLIQLYSLGKEFGAGDDEVWTKIKSAHSSFQRQLQQCQWVSVGPDEM